MVRGEQEALVRSVGADEVVLWEDAVAEMLASGALQPVVGARLGLDQLADAHRALEARTVLGDVVVDIIPPTPQLAAATA